MIRATILLTFKDGRSFNYANKYLEKKTGTDGYKYNGEDRSTPLLDGIPGACYYYTGLGTDTFEDQSKPGQAKSDYEKLKGQIGKTGLMKFPEADAGHGDTDTIIRNYGENINSGITNDRFSFNLADLVSVDLIEEWIAYPGEEYDKESTYRLPKNSPFFISGKESKNSRTREIYEQPMDLNFVRSGQEVPIPILYLDEKGDVQVENIKYFKEVIKRKVRNGWECYGIVDVKNKVLEGGINKKTGKWEENVVEKIVGTKTSGLAFIPFKEVEKKKEEKISDPELLI